MRSSAFVSFTLRLFLGTTFGALYLRYKRACLTAALFLADRLSEEVGKHLLSQCPVFLVDAILHLGWLDFALNQSGFFQFFQVLRNRGLGYRQFIVDVAEETALLLYQELQDGHAGRMAHCFGKSGYPFLLFCVFLSVISFFSIYCSLKYE